MKPFDDYPKGGTELLGLTKGSNCRHGYGLTFMQRTCQTKCAYCQVDLVQSFENWLQMALDHVIPKNVCRDLCIRDDWREDCINKVLACSACNSFDNRYRLGELPQCPSSLEDFCKLRDCIFEERCKRVAIRRQKEHEFFNRGLWKGTGKEQKP
jgi:hypothetical protein